MAFGGQISFDSITTRWHSYQNIGSRCWLWRLCCSCAPSQAIAYRLSRDCDRNIVYVIGNAIWKTGVFSARRRFAKESWRYIRGNWAITRSRGRKIACACVRKFAMIGMRCSNAPLKRHNRMPPIAVGAYQSANCKPAMASPDDADLLTPEGLWKNSAELYSQTP